jgi:hypothetical protein
MIVRGPGIQAGTISQDLTGNIDLAPTPSPISVV